MIVIENHGPLITASNFWDAETAQRGYLYLSINGGAFRLLCPDSQRRMITDMRPGAKHVVVSMLPPDQWRERQFCVEWMVEDGGSTPWACHLSPAQIDRAPGHDDVGREWIASVWDRKNGRPHKCLERPAFFQIVPKLPWLKNIEK